jgi:predicted GNAT family N-acyltransferase
VTVKFRLIRETDLDDVMRLRDIVYVKDQERIAAAGDLAEAFDRFDAHADYIGAYTGDVLVGTVKVVPDSAIGLPCDAVVDLSRLRGRGNTLVEMGHLMTRPEARERETGLALMREGFIHAVRKHRVTHLLGDFFVDDGGEMLGFYRELGFVPLHEPYADIRFRGAPLGLVALLDVEQAVDRSRTGEGRASRRLQYFFHDYDTYAVDSHALEGPAGASA